MPAPRLSALALREHQINKAHFKPTNV